MINLAIFSSHRWLIYYCHRQVAEEGQEEEDGGAAAEEQHSWKPSDHIWPRGLTLPGCGEPTVGEQSESILQQIWPDVFPSSSPPTSTAHFTYSRLLPYGTHTLTTAALTIDTSSKTPSSTQPAPCSSQLLATLKARNQRRESGQGTSWRQHQLRAPRVLHRPAVWKIQPEPCKTPCVVPLPKTSVPIVSPVQFLLSVLAKIKNILWLNEQTYHNYYSTYKSTSYHVRPLSYDSSL